MGTPPQSDFQPLPNRDAWGAIRGYVYQADTTLLRWLDLKDPEQLALECGEDIDRIGPVIDAAGKIERLVEQIKYRDRNITLRSPEAVEAIASFHAQRELNPDIFLRFRFVSNAPPGNEMPPKPFSAPSGILLWGALQRNALSATDAATALQGIRALLRAAPRPEGFNQQRWDRFQEHLAGCNTDDLLGFVRAFEWGLGEGDVNDVRDRVRGALVESGRATFGADAQRKHAHLFLCIFRVLISPRQKRLTAADLDQALAADAVATVDTAILKHLEELRGFIESQIADVARSAQQIQPKLDEGLRVSREILQISLNTQNSVRQLSDDWQKMAGAPTFQGLQAALDVLVKSTGAAAAPTVSGGSELPETEPPPLVAMASLRDETIKSLFERAGEKAWCAIHGISGTGKTQLACLAVGYIGTKCIWLRLRDLDPAAAARRVSAVLESISPRLAQPSETWLAKVCSAVGAGALIVLDDLPGADSHGALNELLARVCAACQRGGIRMLSTANKSLAASVRSLVAPYLHEEPVPLLLDGEIADIFRQHSSPEQFVSGPFLKVVQQVSKGHPVLVVEAARYLQAEGWKWNSRALDAVVFGSFAADLEMGTADDVRRTVRDAEARELLYRIKLIGWPFTEEQVQWVADVHPAISLFLEKFSALVGLWVQRDSATQFAVSPLIATMKASNLPKERKKLVHLALAEGVLQRRRLGAVEGWRVIFHFVSAEHYNEAADILLLALNAIMREKRPVDGDLIMSFWIDLPLPASIDHWKKVLIRTTQIVVRDRLGKDNTYLVEDLDRLLADRAVEQEDGLVITRAAGLLASAFCLAEPSRATYYLTKGILASRRREAAEEIAEAIGDQQEGLLELLWMTGAHVNDDSQFEAWFVLVQGLTPEETRRWGGLANASKCSELVCNGIWMRAGNATDPSPDWAVVISKLNLVRSWALGAGVGSLAVHALRGQIIVTAEYRSDLAGAVLLAEEGLLAQANYAQAQFWITEITGRQFYYQRRYVEALHWFERAFLTASSVDAPAQANALMLAATASAELSITVSVEYLQRAIALIQTAPKDGSLTLLIVQACGELAILRWSAEDRRGAYDAWKRAVEELLGAKVDTDNWRILFQMMGNFSGYFGYMVEPLDPSSWPYAVPRPGILLALPRAVLALYTPGRDWQVFAQMALFADGVDAYEDAVEWAVRLIDNAKQLAPGMDAFIRRYRLPRLLGDGRLVEAIGEATAGSRDRSPDEVPSQDSRPDDPGRVAQFKEQSGRRDLVAIAIELVRRRLENSESAARLTSDVAAACRQAVEGRGASSWWAQAGGAIASLASRDAGWRKLYEQGASLINSDTNLAVVYYLAAMLRAAPKDALQLQMAIVPWLRSTFSKTLFHFTMSLLAAEYWIWALEEYPAHFGLPGVTRSNLETACSLQGEERLRAILRAVATSLGVEPETPEVKGWLLNRD